jgi:hypothetical protein
VAAEAGVEVGQAWDATRSKEIVRLTNSLRSTYYSTYHSLYTNSYSPNNKDLDALHY